MIDGVMQTPLKQVGDERGKIMHMMRATDTGFERFGEVYFSWINPHIVKGWHRHSVVTVNLAVPVGKVKIVVFDDREDSKTKGQIQEFIVGPQNYNLISIAAGLWYGFSCLMDVPSMIANCATDPHDPDESEHCDLADINYDWSVDNV
ncbi:MAG: dTDP-4-dehydrorhamnose 3,5-epimerase [Alphaproteobacteria bacterium]|nr:MAG: dTDP-4-dehydrorhamnose 3,5-epimerase [Alphaproteobacteria bacterium]